MFQEVIRKKSIEFLFMICTTELKMCQLHDMLYLAGDDSIV